MAEKLSEASWSAFSKKRDLDDAVLLKALARFDKTDDAKPDARLDAVTEVVAQINKLIIALAKRKKELGDKPFTEAKDKLHALLDEAEKVQKQTRAAKDVKESESSDDEESPALLTSRMIPLLRQLRKPDVQMFATICTAGKATSVLVMNKPIAMARRKMLAAAIDAKAGAKYIDAHCLYEKNALTFVVPGSAGALAKRIAAALLAQTDLRLKVRVRGEDGSLEEDGEDEEAGGTQAEADADVAIGKDPSPSALLWERRAPGVRAAVENALKANHPQASKLRAVLGFASEKAETAHDHDGALKALDMLEQLLKQPSTPPVGSGSGTSTVATQVVYTQSRLAWVATRGKVKSEVDKLKSAILSTYQGQSVIGEVTQSMDRLDAVLEAFDESLIEKLDQIADTTDPAGRQRLHDESRDIIARYQRFLASDPLVAQLDDNPFVPITVQKALTATLSTLASKIA